MKIVKTDYTKQNITLAQLEALAQFEASQRAGQAVFHPWVRADSPAPHCVVLPEGLTRIAVTYLDGEHWVKDGQWYRRDDAGAATQVEDVLERCWQAAMAIRSRLKEERGISAYVVAVAVFTGMGPDASIVAAAAGRSTRVLFGMDDHVERLAALLGELDLKHPLKAGYILDDAKTLSRQPDASAANRETVERESASLDIGDGRVVIHAGIVHIHVHITVVAAPNGGGNTEDDPPTVAGI